MPNYILLPADGPGGRPVEPGTQYPTLEAAMLAAHIQSIAAGKATPDWSAHCYGDRGETYADSHWQGAFPDSPRPADGGPFADWYIRPPR